MLCFVKIHPSLLFENRNPISRIGLKRDSEFALPLCVRLQSLENFRRLRTVVNWRRPHAVGGNGVERTADRDSRSRLKFDLQSHFRHLHNRKWTRRFGAAPPEARNHLRPFLPGRPFDVAPCAAPFVLVRLVYVLYGFLGVIADPERSQDEFSLLLVRRSWLVSIPNYYIILAFL